MWSGLFCVDHLALMQIARFGLEEKGYAAAS